MKDYILSRETQYVVIMRKLNPVRQALIFLVMGVASIGVAWVLSRLSAAGLFPMDPVAIVGASMAFLLVCIVLAFLTMLTNVMSGNRRMGQPGMPDRDVITRVVRDDSSGKDYFLYGDHDDTVKEILMDDWPFAADLKNTSWHLVDERHNDVTDKILSAFEGTAKIIFD